MATAALPVSEVEPDVTPADGGDWVDEYTNRDDFGRFELAFDEATGGYVLRDLRPDAEPANEDGVSAEPVDAEAVEIVEDAAGTEADLTEVVVVDEEPAPVGPTPFAGSLPGLALGNAFHTVDEHESEAVDFSFEGNSAFAGALAGEPVSVADGVAFSL
jgi:hypothetical protein